MERMRDEVRAIAPERLISLNGSVRDGIAPLRRSFTGARG
jgi:hypothetical protein